MCRRTGLQLGVLVVALGLAPSAAEAWAGGWWTTAKYGTTWERLHRAGNPHRVAPWARCSFTASSDGYYVGGGTPHLFGREKCPEEGTWGWDYDPTRWLVPRVALRWTHGRYQGGTGSYEPDKDRVFQSHSH